MKTGLQKIRCPFCGVALSVNVREEQLGYSIKCPRCKKIAPLMDFEPIDEPDRMDYQEKTDYRNSGESTTYESATREKSAGTVCVTDGRHEPFRLKVGNNIIGRDGEGSKADFKIKTPNEKRLSREHIIIIVERCSDGSYRHFVKLYKEKVNATYINNERIEPGDCLILKDGYTIEMPGVTLEFKE